MIRINPKGNHMARPKKGQAAPAKPAAKIHNLVDPDIRKLFLVHRDAYAKAKKKVDDAQNAFRTLQGVIKGDGFKIIQIKDAIWLSTPEGEAEFKAEISQRLLAAAYVGAEIGSQLSLFLEPDRTPATERARHEGELAAIEHKTHAPPYDASVPQYKAWSEGFYAEQERQIKGGISKLDDKKAAANAKGGKKRGRPAKGPNADPPAGAQRTLIPKAEKEAKAAARAVKPPEPPRTKPSAAPVTRSTIKAEKEAARETAESYFSKSEPAGNA
jgi:hypothetical protein